jgi:hypothetical protein
MPGYVVQTNDPTASSERRYYVVCDSESAALSLVTATLGAAAGELRVLRKLSPWEVTVFDLEPQQVRPAP